MPTITGFSHPLGDALIPGGPIGEFKVPGGLKPNDALLAVLHITDGATPVSVNRTGEFSITAGKAGSVTNTTTVTTGGYLLVVWAKTD